MNLILLGPPGAGKGTQAKLLLNEFNVPQISTGDILRAAVAAGTELGKVAGPLMSAGKLVPDDIVVGIAGERLKQKDCDGGFVLDGFPRTIPQAEALEAMLEKVGRKVQKVISIEVNDDAIVERMGGRRSCPKCGAVYHVKANPPKKARVCDACGGELVQRADDAAETVKKRLVEYANLTAPLKAFYAKRDLLAKVDGMGTTDEVFGLIKKALGR